MTTSYRIAAAGASLALALALTLGVGMCSYQIARAQPAVVDAGIVDAMPSPAIAPPAAAPTSKPSADSDPLTFIEASYNAIKSGNWTHVVAFCLILSVWVSRQKWALGRIAFFRTDRGGVIMVFALSLLGGLAHALLATKGLPSLGALKTVGLAAFMAIGGYVGLRRMLLPADKATP